MHTIIVGGTGGIGAYIALAMRAKGEAVTVSARRAPDAASPVAAFPFIAGDYVGGSFSVDQLRGFDQLIFAAGNDIRQVPRGSDAELEAEFYLKANSQAVPRFFALAKEAGIRRTAYIGSFYPQAKPELVKDKGYVRSRLDADQGARAFADARFHVVSLNAPWVVGAAPGLPTGLYDYLTRWALGKMPQVALTAPPGGSQFISVKSVCEAVLGGLAHGDNGRGYLIGDANLYYKDLFELIFRLAGRDKLKLEIRDEEHPILTDRSLFAGRAATVFYAPQGVEQLGYSQNDVERALKEIVDAIRDRDAPNKS